jgi:hypothetical protein
MGGRVADDESDLAMTVTEAHKAAARRIAAQLQYSAPAPQDETWPDDEVGQLKLLCRWLALPLGDNRPVFATELPDGTPLETGRNLEALFDQVCPIHPRVTPGTWWRCPSCDLWQIRSDLPTPPDWPIAQ